MSTKLENPFAIKSISKMYLASNLADVHFTFPEDDPTEKVPAHKLILASASKVFEAMFFGSLKEADVVKITDSNADAFKEFLQLVYLPEISLTMANLGEVLRLADKYDMLECFDTCAPFIERHLTIENLPIGYQLAIKFNNLELKTFCERLIRGVTKDVLKSESFLQCNREVVENILQQNALECNETDLFEACIAWAKSACQRNGLDENNSENWKNQLGDCFRLIRFAAMDGKKMNEILSNEVYNNLLTREELTDIAMKKFDPNFQSKIFTSVPRSKALSDTIKFICKSQLKNVYFIKNQESTWFSTNEPILLTNIKGCPLKILYSLEANLEIVEYNSNTIATNAPFEVLRKILTSYALNMEHGVRTPPIIIKPKKIYEIRWNISIDYKPFHFYSFEFTDVKVNDKVIITFHQNPLDSEMDRRGLVRGLEFYRL